MRSNHLAMVLAASVGMAGGSAHALTYSAFDTNPDFVVTPEKPGQPGELQVGTGITNGSFTKVTQNGVEVGARAKLRYDDSSTPGQPRNRTNYDGVKTYSFDPEDGNAPAGLAIWNYETSISLSHTTLGDHWLKLSVTDPLGGAFALDNSFFLLGVGAGLQGPVLGSFIDRTSLQDSQNIGFNFITDAGVDPFLTGVYDISLAVHACVGGSGPLCTEAGIELAAVDIHVNQVPVPAALPMLASAIGGLLWMRRRTQKAA